MRWLCKVYWVQKGNRRLFWLTYVAFTFSLPLSLWVNNLHCSTIKWIHIICILRKFSGFHFFPYLHTEVQCLNETQKYLHKIVHEIGLELRSTAVCKGVRRTRDGCFTLQDALTRNHWTASDIMGAIQQYHSTKKKKKFSHSQNMDSRLQSEEFKITTSE